MERKKIFVSAYACDPDRGSEQGVGWNWILQMSKHYKLWVMTRSSNKENIDKWFEKHPNTNQIDFVYYDLPEKYRKWKDGDKGVRKYYMLWQKQSEKLVMQTMMMNDIEIYHLITFGNALWPASKYGMSKTFIWGPIGGIESVEKEYVRDFRIKVRMIEFIRRLAIKTLKLNSGFKKRCENADVIICKSEEVKNNLPEKAKEKAIVCTDVAVDKKQIKSINKESDKEITSIYAAGRLDGWRGFNLLIEAFNNALNENENLVLRIAGDGLVKNDLEKISQKNRDKIELLGYIDKEAYQKNKEEADVIINPVLREGGVTLAYDSMALGKPLVCIDTKGYTNNVDRDAAIIIDKNNRGQIVREMTVAILKLTDEKERENLGQKAREWASKNTWDEKEKEIVGIIEKA